jgi:DNA-binding response OmpR family regulator
MALNSAGIKENIETSHIPFLMLTAKDSIESKLEGVESGADFYFAKPLSIQLLTLTIRNILNQKQKLKTKYFKDHYSEAKELVHSRRDKEFMEQLITIIESHLTDPGYGCGLYLYTDRHEQNKALPKDQERNRAIHWRICTHHPA